MWRKKSWRKNRLCFFRLVRIDRQMYQVILIQNFHAVLILVFLHEPSVVGYSVLRRNSITMRVDYCCVSTDHASSGIHNTIEKAMKYSRYIFSQLQSLLISGCPIKSYLINVKNILRDTDNKNCACKLWDNII